LPLLVSLLLLPLVGGVVDGRGIVFLVYPAIATTAAYFAVKRPAQRCFAPITVMQVSQGAHHR